MRTTALPKSFRRTLGVALLALAGLGLVEAASTPQEDHEEGPLASAMEEMQSSLRSLRKLLADPAQAPEAIEVVHAMQANALIAFAQEPRAPEGADEQAAVVFNLDFRQSILGLVGELLTLERALVEGRTEDAKDSYKRLGEIKKASHDKFQVDD